ncbi:gastrokine-2-like isoform X2 [Dermochelys coriacea]|uniref:gastrokine-2-like isoform X2 n=1 Tax=Dermochelys coriacea TaxID=27794 RepID=UPI001CA81312|nr:gastrokine-2-like isoform X2 [Dermochelys coriacea]
MCLLQIIQISSSGSNREVTEQMMMVSSQETVAAFHIEGNTTSATVVYDYKHGLLGLRVQDRRKCLVVKMDKVAIPSLAEITQKIENFATHGSGEDSLSYTFSEGQLANRTALGTALNILCMTSPSTGLGALRNSSVDGASMCTSGESPFTSVLAARAFCPS